MKLQPCPGFVIVVFADICCGTGLASNQAIGEGDLFRGEALKFEAREEVQLMVIHTGQNYLSPYPRKRAIRSFG